MQPSRWRKYPDWQGCIDDHAAFLLANPRYKPAFSCRDGEAFAGAAVAASDKLIAVMRGRQQAFFDRPEAP